MSSKPHTTNSLQIFKPILDEAKEMFPGINDLEALYNYYEVQVKIYTSASDQARRNEGLKKAVLSKQLISFFMEGRN
jgi:hypothetical protein